MTIFEDLIPDPLPPGMKVLYGTVTGSSPLRVQVDTDPGPLPITPVTTVACTVGDRVVILSHVRADAPHSRARAYVIVGVVGGGLTLDPIPDPTMESGWSLDSISSWSQDGLASWTLKVTRTGSNITSGSTGNISDTQICTIDAAWRPPASVYTSFQTGLTSGGVQVNSAGEVTIRDANTNSTISTGDGVSITTPPYLI